MISSVPGASSSSAASRDERGDGASSHFFPRFQKSATPPSGSALWAPHSSPWTLAACDVPITFEEEEESEL